MRTADSMSARLSTVASTAAVAPPPPFRNVTSKPAPAAARQRLKDLFAPHVDSFDHFLTEGLRRCIAGLEAQEVEHPSGGPRLRVWLERMTIAKPEKREQGSLDSARPLYPAECRERACTYKGPCRAVFCVQVGEGDPERIEVRLGLMPIMVRSKLCHLHGLKGKQLAAKHEEMGENGGYFICNGNERAIRLLIAPRRNHPMAITRSSFKNRGADYSADAVSIRCVRPDGSSQTVGLHLLTTGGATLRLTIQKQEFFVPVVLLLKALRECSDAEIYARVLGGDESDSYVSDRIQKMLREHHTAYDTPLLSQRQCLAFLGHRFRHLLRPSERTNAVEAGELLLRRHIFVHLPSDGLSSKWDLLVLMLQKLYALGARRISQDNPDSLVHQEVLLPGQIWAMICKERLSVMLQDIKTAVERELRNPKDKEAPLPSFSDDKWLRTTIEKAASRHDLGRKLEYFLATGNLVSETGLDLQQTAGFTIVAERLNFWRYISHFRSIHRGAFFTQLRTTTVRKLLPDSWGFLCPVHTPDGSPCGLLNHLSRNCSVVQHASDRSEVLAALAPTLAGAGAVLLPLGATLPSASYLPILLDAMLIGRVHVDAAQELTAALRRHKLRCASAIGQLDEGGGGGDGADEGGAGSAAAAASALLQRTLASLEVALVSATKGGTWPALFLASTAARFLRPVQNAWLGATELIGPLEQTTLRIAYAIEDYKPKITSHYELDPTQLFSVVSSLTPFCDFNQSPRNMYQCQMGKQTMGTPYQNHPHRVDTKVYKLQTPQSPIVRNRSYDEYALDEYPNGANAVVAVISYTGYDMEDAMCINKMSYERGFGHGSVYLNVTIDLREMRRPGEPLTHRFGNTLEPNGPPTPPAGTDHNDELLRQSGPRLYEPTLGPDGFPAIGQLVKHGEPLCAIVDESTGRHMLKRHKKTSEDVYVEEIRLIGGEGQGTPCEKATIKLRINRNPIPGDKFASRHGQKGVMSRLWPAENMPFTESGLQPDILFNPHGFPSRMTIGMLLESMAGKAGACHGVAQEATPFRFSEKHRAVDYFGEQLRACGYAYHGTEPMYSGLYGTEMEVQIFVGIVYYQRLRHMVSDKDQVRLHAV